MDADPDSLGVHTSLSAWELKTTLGALPNNKAPGADGVFPEHLKSFLANEARLEDSLLPVINLLAKGRFPMGVFNEVKAGRVTPLFKDEERSKIRPIVPLNILRKITGAALMRKEKQGLHAALAPHQWGAGQEAGVESVLHWIRTLLEESSIRDPPSDQWGVVSLDFSNAFGEVSRPHALCEVAGLEAASLAPFLVQQYGRPTPLRLPRSSAEARDGKHLGESYAESAEGVTQGDH